MGSEDKLTDTVKGFIEKNKPELIGILTSGLSEVKGDDVQRAVKSLESAIGNQNKDCSILHIPTPDYAGGLETGYAKAVEAIIESIVVKDYTALLHRGLSEVFPKKDCQQTTMTNNLYVNVLVGSHLTPADFTELREIIESFGLRPIILPDLSALDGSRVGFSALATGGTKVEEIEEMRNAGFTIAIGASMENSAKVLKDICGIEYKVLDSVSGLRSTDLLMETLSLLSGKPIPSKYERQRRILVDSMRDAHFYYGGKKVCIALDSDLATQTSHWLSEMSAIVELAVVPYDSPSMDKILAKDLAVGDLFSIKGKFDVLISNSHAEDRAKGLGVPLYQMGFPVYKVLGNCSKVTIGYRGTITLINEVANKLWEVH
jgi:nitrogenase molybdenum-iron protein alpha/beta subunit